MPDFALRSMLLRHQVILVLQIVLECIKKNVVFQYYFPIYVFATGAFGISCDFAENSLAQLLAISVQSCVLCMGRTDVCVSHAIVHYL